MKLEFLILENIFGPMHVACCDVSKRAPAESSLLINFFVQTVIFTMVYKCVHVCVCVCVCVYVCERVMCFYNSTGSVHTQNDSPVSEIVPAWP